MVEVGEGRGWGGMASVASEADRSLARMFMVVLAPDQAKHPSTIDPIHTVHPSTSITASWGRHGLAQEH